MYNNCQSIDYNNLYSGNYNNLISQDTGDIRQRFQNTLSIPKESRENTERISFIMSCINEHESISNCIDIGSGIGIFPYEFSKLVDNLICIDPDSASTSFTSTFPGVTSLCMSMEEFLESPNAAKVQSGSILITLNQVLEHFSDPLTSLSELTQRFRSDFYIYIEVPESIRNLDDYGADCPAFFLDHRHIFSTFSLSYIVQMAGISVLNSTSARTQSGKTVIRCFGHYSYSS